MNVLTNNFAKFGNNKYLVTYAPCQSLRWRRTIDFNLWLDGRTDGLPDKIVWDVPRSVFFDMIEYAFNGDTAYFDKFVSNNYGGRGGEWSEAIISE